MLDRRRLGLCYNCDEKYVRGHKCAKLFYLEVVNTDDDESDTQEGPPTDEPLISLHAIAGVRTEDTMQVKVQVVEQEFTALIDTGSTHNFFSSQAAQAAELQFEANTGTRVTIANGDSVPCSGLARDVEIKIGKDIFTINAYSIPLDCFDMVLGVSFLKPLHTVLMDFDDLIMAFNHNGKRVLWKGLGSPRCNITTTSRLHAITHESTVSNLGQPTDNNNNIKQQEGKVLQQLLDSFTHVFQEPKGLPPSRDCDHRIHLKPNTEPIAVHPYKYP
jgi:hypothetical protein